MTNPEYQGFLMALANNASVLNKYRTEYQTNNISNPIDGFVLIGIMFTESSAGIDEENLIGSTVHVYERNGTASVINALIECNLAFSKDDAIELCKSEAFLANCIKLVNHLEVPLTWNTTNYDISTNFTSYAVAEANASRWRNNYKQGKTDFYDYYYSYYSYNDGNNVVYFDDKIINDIGLALYNYISKLHD